MEFLTTSMFGIDLTINCSLLVFCIYVDAPLIYPEVMNQTINEGYTASFSCQATSKPVSTIDWYYNSIIVNNGSDIEKYMISQLSLTTTTIINTLKITSVESSDVGIYTCKATNLVSSKTVSAMLTVNGKLLL